jgi:hypothetical protein
MRSAPSTLIASTTSRPGAVNSLLVQVSHELLQQVGELKWPLLMRGVPGAGDQLDLAAPEARDGQPLM